MFFAVVFIAWLWPTLGGLLLVLTGFVLGAWYAFYFGDKVMLLWPRAPLQAG